jgi:hypothetical protein
MKYDQLTRISPLPPIAALFSALERSRLLERCQSFILRLYQWSRAITQNMLQHLLNRAEPQVSARRDRYGNPFYRVYDPQTGRSTIFGSAAEVRWWLEQRIH